MRQIYLSSIVHYRLRKEQTGEIVLLKYTTIDADGHEDEWSCPGMNNRGPFTSEESEVIERFSEGEEVEFIVYSHKLKIEEDLLKILGGLESDPEQPFCGDDFIHMMGQAERNQRIGPGLH